MELLLKKNVPHCLSCSRVAPLCLILIAELKDYANFRRGNIVHARWILQADKCYRPERLRGAHDPAFSWAPRRAALERGRRARAV